ncbi:MAG: hypothetical protein F6J86_09225 [Symploca sp. SIO1B1]|nr:hypothetical protein [Symploca sp. SIO1B1]
MNIFTQQLTEQDSIIESLLSQLTKAKARKENLEQSQAKCQSALLTVETAIKEMKNYGNLEAIALFRAELEQLFDEDCITGGSDPPEPKDTISDSDSDSGINDTQNTPQDNFSLQPVATISDPETGKQYTVTAVKDSQTGELQYAATTVAPAPTDKNGNTAVEQEASPSVVEAQFTDNQDNAEHPDIVHLGERVIYLRNVGEYAMSAWFGFDLFKDAKAFIKDAKVAFYQISKAELQRTSTRTGCKAEVVLEGDLEISRIEGAAKKLFGWQPPQDPPKPETTLDSTLAQYQLYPEKDRKSFSPLFQHYLATKDANPDKIILFHVGDFYETFFLDAKTISEALELVITSKNSGHPQVGRIPMAGFPDHTLQRYCALLEEKGYGVVVVEKDSNPTTLTLQEEEQLALVI